MQVEEFIRHHEMLYGVGTKFTRRFPSDGEVCVIERITDDSVFVKINTKSYCWSKNYFIESVLEIVKPVYHSGEKSVIKDTLPYWDVKMGWFYYILIMVVGTLFISRWLIYIAATAAFFLWKNGNFNKED